MRASQSRRSLFGLLAGLLLFWCLVPRAQVTAAGTAETFHEGHAMGNRVAITEVKRAQDGSHLVVIDYVYGGEPAPMLLQLSVLTAEPDGRGKAVTEHMVGPILGALPGSHHLMLTLPRPPVNGAVKSHGVGVRMFSREAGLGLYTSHPYEVQWDAPGVATAKAASAQRSDQQLVDDAVRLIDEGSSSGLREARSLLERTVARNPRHAPAYVEMARVAMKTNWGPEGLSQAEQLLQSALQIEPGHANALVLMGYVHAHQGRYTEAQALFEQAARQQPVRNLWLWANWGELLALQDRTDAAIEKYRMALASPPPRNTYDRARLDAYRNMLVLLKNKQDEDGIEALLLRRAEEYGAADCCCHVADHARHVLHRRGAHEEAVRRLKDVVHGGACGSRQEAREVLGLAYYVAWVDRKVPQRDDFLNQARIYLPPGARALYLMAGSEPTLQAARALMKTGLSVDQRDNRKLSALALALQDENREAAQRLLSLGASPTLVVGDLDMPAALLPVLSGDFESIRMLRKAGVDYRTLRFQGQTALDHARQASDTQLLEALDGNSNAL
jgi:tetratricopeptide (TPR) repeat protein